eukprot:TRINITY_DN38455_c0_g1_i1.p1 TRINITY_DN38455_c0_g1~~TRINITY_DN38455_c0_g1_i1.p1  ORF type:complete len:850 (-),score=83.20 TRINITY_DN38455_c0_g1_i1:1032-3581(-)
MFPPGVVGSRRCVSQNSRALLLRQTIVLAGILWIAHAADEAEAPSPSSSDTQLYTVVLNDLPPTVAYTGTEANYRATAGKNFNPNSAAAKKYAALLTANQRELLESLSIDPSQIKYTYTTLLNGFAIELTAEQASALNSEDVVTAVQEQIAYHTASVHTPSFLELPSTFWQSAGGSGSAGENVIIGVIDTGIDPTHPSFSDQSGYSSISSARPTWKGSCTTAPDFAGCNNKLVGAKYFVQGMLSTAGGVNMTVDSISPIDNRGHGSHCAAIAGGNSGVQASYGGSTTLGDPIGAISGMAPRARIASYKVLWYAPDGSFTGYTADVVAAFEQAIVDGVDIINFSVVTNSAPNVFDAVSLASLHAAKAGVFVAAAGGNCVCSLSSLQPGGPCGSIGTVKNVSPWLMTVANIMDDRVWKNGLTFGGSTVEGRLQTPGTGGMYPIINSYEAYNGSDYSYDGYAADYCYPGYMDPALTKGKIIACNNWQPSYGEEAAIPDTIATVKDLGGVGVVLKTEVPWYGTPNWFPLYISWPADFPMVAIEMQDSDDLVNFIHSNVQAGKVPMASIEGSRLVINTSTVATSVGSSCRGPATATGVSDILKPDIAAPGFNIWSAIRSSTSSEKFDTLTGTSQSTAHISGIAALLRQKNPSWSPYAIKSALLTTARSSFLRGSKYVPMGYADFSQMEIYTTKPYVGDPPQGQFAWGAGLVNTSGALDPGLVYDSSYMDYIGYLWTIDNTVDLGTPYTGSAIQGRDLNLPSIIVSTLSSTSVSVKRNVTRVGTRGSDFWFPIVTDPSGACVSISPLYFYLPIGASATYTATFKKTTGASDYSFGSIKFTNGHYIVNTIIGVKTV